MSSISRQQLEAWLKEISVKGKVLDIGGSQNPIKGRTKTWEAEEYVILDLINPHEVKLMPSIYGDIQEPINYEYENEDDINKEFDIAFCIEVAEYWYDPMQALRNINYFLKQGGELYISFHFIYEIHKPVMMDFLRYTPDGAVELLQKAGFKIRSMRFKEFAHPENAQKLFNEEGMRGLKNLYTIQGCLIRAIKV